MRLGVCYYPEHWPEERWATDARQMRELGLEIVRIAEFTWGKLEPVEGTFDFAWLDRAIDVLATAGLQVVLGTPTATPPAWLSRGYPEILPVDAEGRRRNHGGRRHYCPTSPVYREHCRRIVTAMAGRYGHDERVIGWQIDNEFGGGHTGRCYCPSCAAAFQAWLRERYATLDSLNDAWATVFWSQTYSAWEQVSPPILQLNQPNPSHDLDYRRFSSDSIVAFQQAQVDLLHDLAPGRWTTTNLMGLFADIDHFDLAAGLDFVTWDSYPTGNLERWEAALYGDEPRPGGGRPYGYDMGDPYVTGFAHELTRGLRNKPFWVMEQQAGHINWGQVNPAPRAGTVRLWTWHDVAAGADTCVYFRWRAGRFGQEQYHSGLLNHDATPDIGHAEVASLVADRDAMARIAATPAKARVALLFGYDDLWAMEIQPHRRGFTYLRLAFAWYRALARLGIAVDIVPADPMRRRATGQRDLASYSVVVAPSLHVTDAAAASDLRAFVKGGGTLVLGVRSGVKTTSSLITDAPLPGVWRDLVGATVTDWHALPASVAYPLASRLAPSGEDDPLGSGATVWAEALAPDPGAGGPTVLAWYPRGPLAGSAAITDRRVGAGRVIYCGIHPALEQAMAVVGRVAADAELDRLGDLPDGLLAYRRGDEAVVLNFTDAPLSAALAGAMTTVPARSVRIVSVEPRTAPHAERPAGL